MTFRARGLISRLPVLATAPFLRFLPRQHLSLANLATLHRSDKGHRWFSRHGYTDVYDPLFRPLKHAHVTLLEIGLRHDPFYGSVSTVSPSLCMWHDYFPNARIVGFDINDFTSMTGGRLVVLRGDQGRVEDLVRLRETVPAFDIIIDDGSHASWHQRLTLETLFSALNPGGLYIVEDLHARPAALEASLPATPLLVDWLRTPGCLQTLGITAADVRLEKDGRLAVIQRPANPVTRVVRQP